ncbi:MAG TPA: hypothetical protein VKH61_18255, partial [Streptosporangiaceae bacterium]|nr:hypothetical protein [Streptosporangiaceae bacterium]
STHTVAHHLRQAFRKLHIASRYELTRIVIEQAADGPAHLALLVAGGSRWFRSGPSCGTASAAPGRRDGLPTRTGDCGLLPQLPRHAHGHLADPRRELCRPRRLDRTRPSPG